MRCPHCGNKIDPNWRWGVIATDDGDDDFGWGWKMGKCPRTDCGETLVRVGTFQHEYNEDGRRNPSPIWNSEKDYLVWPRRAQRIPLGHEVPQHIKEEYREACTVLLISAKASAALSRRALESILEQQGYTEGFLYEKIKAILSENSLPPDINDTIQTVRRFGNFSSHPPSDRSGNGIADVDPGEADWCLDVIERLINYFYTDPVKASAIAAKDGKMIARAEELGEVRKPASR